MLPQYIKNQVAVIKASTLFDTAWYLERYPDVAELGMDPIEHYVRFGAGLLRSPHPLFDTRWYMDHHADVRSNGIEPLLHFLKYGQFEGRKTKPVGGSHPTYSLCVNRKGGLNHKTDAWDAAREASFLGLLAGRPAPAGIHCSVIMPTYNRAGSIASAIASVVAQTNTNWELIIVDDGSTDATGDVVEPWLADPRIRLVSQRQGGVAKARNAGLEAHGGKYVFYLDSDNTWREDFLANMVAFMATTSVDAAYCGALCYGDPGRPAHFRGDDFSWAECLRENYVDMNCFGHRSGLAVEAEGFDESLKRLVDWDFILRMTRVARTAYAPFCGVRYYDGSGGGRISHTHHVDGTLNMVAAGIRAKHEAGPADRPRESTAEDLLAATEARPEQPGGEVRSIHWPAYDRRIGYVIWDWPALSQTFVFNEIRALLARGADVKVYYKVPAETPADIDLNVEAYAVDGVESLASLVREHGRTVLHSPFVYPTVTLLTWPCSLATGVPFTFMPGGVDISHYENMRRNRVAEIAASGNCLGVITIGTFHRDFLIEQGVPAAKLVLERQAVALPKFTPRYEAAPHPRVVSIARFIEKKGLGNLLEVAALFPDATVHLYGFGPLENELHEKVRQLGLSNVHFEQPLGSTATLHAAYRDADLFVLPCVRAANGDLDGLPTVILEAMASGVPVVSTDISNIPDVIIDGVTGFLAKPGDVASLTEKVRQAMSMTIAGRRAMIDAARELVENYANDGRTVTTLERIWARLPTEAAGSPA